MIVDSFITHCFIEFYYRTDKGFLNEHNSLLTVRHLNEKYGVFDGCELLARMIADKILKNNDKSNFSIYINNKWISKIEISIFEDKFSNVGALYSATESEIIEQKNNRENVYKFFPLKLEINLARIDKQKLIVRLMHELTHAYEDYNRQIKGNDSLLYLSLKDGDYLNIVGTYQGLKQVISYVLYYIREYERNAFITQMQGELTTQENFYNIENILKFLYNTEVYKNYTKIILYITKLNEISDIEKQNNILNYVKDLSNYSFNTYKQLCKFLNVKKYEISKKMNTILPKIAYDNLKFGNFLNSFNENIEDNLENFLI